MVERRMRASIKLTGDLWFTAWVEAGQPDLSKLIDYQPTSEELKAKAEEWKNWEKRTFPARSHE
jgi:hypothetical protein